MKHREAFARYRLLDERLRRKPHPRLEDLIEYLGEQLGKSVSPRTINTDMQEMRYSQNLGFNAPIVFNRSTRCYQYKDPGYSINNLQVSSEELHGLDFAVSILEQFKHLPAIKEFEEAIRKIQDTVRANKEVRGESDFIQLERNFPVRGLEYVEPLIRAITQKQRVKFLYQRYDKDKAKEHLLEPYLIKEYRNFWYVVGNDVTKENPMVLTFALDRLSGLELQGTFFSPASIDKKSFYKNTLGVTVGSGKTERVVLSCTPLQGKYFKAQPIHTSQKILRDTKTELRLRLDVVLNYELRMQLLSYGANVKVLQPKKLVDEIKSTAKQMLKHYK